MDVGPFTITTLRATGGDGYLVMGVCVNGSLLVVVCGIDWFYCFQVLAPWWFLLGIHRMSYKLCSGDSGGVIMAPLFFFMARGDGSLVVMAQGDGSLQVVMGVVVPLLLLCLALTPQ